MTAELAEKKTYFEDLLRQRVEAVQDSLTRAVIELSKMKAETKKMQSTIEALKCMIEQKEAERLDAIDRLATGLVENSRILMAELDRHRSEKEEMKHEFASDLEEIHEAWRKYRIEDQQRKKCSQLLEKENAELKRSSNELDALRARNNELMNEMEEMTTMHLEDAQAARREYDELCKEFDAHRELTKIEIAALLNSLQASEDTIKVLQAKDSKAEDISSLCSNMSLCDSSETFGKIVTPRIPSLRTFKPVVAVRDHKIESSKLDLRGPPRMATITKEPSYPDVRSAKRIKVDVCST